MKKSIHLTLGILAAPVCIGPAFAANECGAPVGGVVSCTAPDKAGVSYTTAKSLDVQLGSFNITTTGLAVTGTAGSAITVGSNGAAVTNITSAAGAGVTLSSTGGAGIVSLVYNNGGTISGKTNAVSATNAGTGGIFIGTGAGTNLAATTGQGINAVVSGTAGGITVDAQGTIGATAPVGGVGLLANISNAANTAAIGIAIGGTINANGDAIRATTSGTGNVSVDLNAAATSATANGLRATTTSGDIRIGANANIAGKTGIAASATGTGPASTGKVDVTVGSGVAITATGGTALAASSAGTGGVTVTTGAGSSVQATGGTGIAASVSGTSSGGVFVDAGGTVTSVGSGSGITASVSSATNPGNIAITARAAVAGASSGISASAFGIGNVTVTANGTVTGGSLDGIAATARKGGTVLVTANGQVTGQRNGFSLGTAATGGSTANVNGNATGTTGEAISAVSGGLGGTTVNVGSNVTLTAGRFGILALAGGDGSTITGIAGNTTVNTDANVTINAATWNAIEADADGGGNVAVTTGTGSMSGTNAIFARTSAGAGTVTIDTSGNLTGTNVVGPGGSGGRGIWVAAVGTGGIDIKTAAGATITADSDGILATSAAASGTAGTNAIRIDGGSTINAARGSGVRAEITAAGNGADVFLNSHADITGGTHGASLITAGAGALKVSNAGLLKGLGGAGLSAQSTTGAIAISSSGTIMGSVAGISLAGGAAQVDNAGTVQNLSGVASDLAIKGTGGATSINNTGLVTGTVVLGNLGNSFTNAGRWNTSGGTNDFGAGSNAVVNAASGTIVAAQNAAVAETTTFSRLATFTNNGTLSMQDGAVGDRTVISGNYFSNGATLRMDVDTQALKSDLLVLDGGAATGSTAIVLNNIATMGAMTAGNGIELVDTVNGATTAVGAFRLGSRVAAGAYEYLLYRGGNAATGGNTNDQNFYLRSTVEVSPPPAPPNPPNPPPPGEPVPPAPPAVTVPNYRNEVFVDMAAPSMASRFGLAMASTLDERIGNEASASGPAWGRAFGDTGRANPGAFATHGPSYRFNMSGLQVGLDVWRQANPEGSRDAVGVYVGAGRIDADVNNGSIGGRAGTAKLDGYSFGAYWTHRAPQGWYTDAVLQGTRYDPISTTSLQGQTLRSSGSGYLASLEGGYRFNLDGEWSLTPQAQLIYQRLSLHGGVDAYGRIDYQGSNTGYARLGAKLARTARWGEGADARELTFWARANLWHGFGGDAQTTFRNLAGGNPVSLKTDLGGTWANLGVGVSSQVSKNVSAFAVADYNRSVDSAKSHSISLKAGVTARW